MNMITEKTVSTPVNTEEVRQPDLVKRIGKTTYKVKAHFSTTSTETMSDKIMRMLRYDAMQLDLS